MRNLLNLLINRPFVYLSIILLAACAAPKTPAQAVYQLQGTYAAALSLEVSYAKLPKCKPEVVAVCSKPEVTTKVKRASDVAWNAIQAAQIAVRTPNYGDDLRVTVVATAEQAVEAYLQITNTLQTH